MCPPSPAALLAAWLTHRLSSPTNSQTLTDPVLTRAKGRGVPVILTKAKGRGVPVMPIMAPRPLLRSALSFQVLPRNSSSSPTWNKVWGGK